MRSIAALVLAALPATLPLPAAAADAPPPGASSCTGCHGADADAAIPPLAGRPAEEIAAAMAAFADGSRDGAVMNHLAPGFTAAETAAIADWFAAQEPE